MTPGQKQAQRMLFNLEQQMAKALRELDRLQLQERLIAEKKRAAREEITRLDGEIAAANS